MVRDEADIIQPALEHLLEQGVARILVADNLSTDGTREILKAFAARHPELLIADDREPIYYQSAKMTWLAHQASRRGASWIVPFDADEFWFAPGMGLADYLLEQPPGFLYGALHNMVPAEVTEPAELRKARFVIDSTPEGQGKVAFAGHPLAVVAGGNHTVARVGKVSKGLGIAHAIYRSPQQIMRKVRQGAVAAAASGQPSQWFERWITAAGLDDVAVEQAWDRVRRGEPDAGLGIAATGPMRTLRPLTWTTWDPNGELSREGR